MKKFVVTGVAGSKFEYTAALFESIGIHVTFERTPRNRKQTEDSLISWYEAPRISSLSDDTVVLHQVRDPLDWLNDWMRLTKTWSSSNTAYVNEKSRLLCWDRSERPKEDMKIWVLWNNFVTDQIGTRPYLRFQIEKMDVIQLQQIASLIDLQLDVVKASEKILAISKEVEVPPALQNRLPQFEVFNWADLPSGNEFDSFKELATSYGYEVPNV